MIESNRPLPSNAQRRDQHPANGAESTGKFGRCKFSGSMTETLVATSLLIKRTRIKFAASFVLTSLNSDNLMHRIFPLALSAICFCMLASSTVWGQQRIESFLIKVDVNNNGKIETGEMTPPVQRYLKRKGFNTEKAVRIKSVVKLVSKNIDEAAKNKVGGKPDQRNVPSFGGDSEDARKPVANFSTSAAPEFSEEVIKQSEELLQKYDRNKNSVLDANEIRRIPWGRPRPEENDLNGDGKLSLYEIQSRYQNRDNAEQNKDRSQERQRAKSKAAAAVKAKEKLNKKNKTASLSSTRAKKRSSNKQKSSSGSKRADELKKVNKYVNNFFKEYDTNNNGFLDKDELKKMRRPPKKQVDTSKDGRISRQELIVSLTTEKKDSPASVSTSQRGQNRTRESSRGSNPFGKRDVNDDGRLQMHEFADKWTEKVLEEFNQKDANGDGVISAEEW